MAANSSYQSPFNATSLALHGGVLVWDFARGDKLVWGYYAGDKEAFDVERLLPPELLANSLDGNMTLFAIVGQSEKTVGSYSNGRSAIQIYRDVLVVKWPDKEVIGRHTVAGDSPPVVITVPEGSKMGAHGDITAPTAEWILRLPK